MTAPAILNAAQLAGPDALYEQLLDATREMSAGECARFYARLTLLLANAVDDEAVVAACIRGARSTS